MKKKNSNFLTVLLFIVLFCVVARLIVGLLYFNKFDTYWYRQWAVGLQEGLFDVYSRADEISLDYPPVYLFFLYLTGLAYRFFGIDCVDTCQMFLMKFWPIFFDGICVLVIYKASLKYGEKTALFAALCWALNPSVFFNTAFWGQTDQLMALLLIFAFYLAKERPIASCVCFAVAGLTKYQSLFFTPVLLSYVLREHGWQKLIKGIGSAALTVAAVFLPFMIGAKNPFLFFDVYLGGVGTYKYCTFNAYNIFAMLGLNTVLDSETAVFNLSYSTLNIIVLLFIVGATVFLILKGRRTNIYVGGLLIMVTLFMFVTRMHERYLIVALPFALMAYVTTKNRHFITQFALLTVTTLVNQAAVLLNVNDQWPFFLSQLDKIEFMFSFFNLLIFFYVAYASIAFFMGKEKENDLYKAKI